MHTLDGQSILLWNIDEQEMVNQYINSGGFQSWEPLRINIPLLGYHQVENAATAYAVIDKLISLGFRINLNDILTGFKNVEWPGRFEILRKKPPVIIDGAQNQDSALKLRLAIDDYLPGYPVILVFGASEDKDVGGMFKDLLPRVRTLIATQSKHPRAMEAEEIIKNAYPFGTPAEIILPLEEAFKTALTMAGNECAVVAAGSLFVAAAARETWTEINNELSK
jgi:dihydrofolate synthase/folylpolyglutamate synthase